MNKEDLIVEFTRILQKAPNLMSATIVAKFAPFGQKRARELIKSGELRSINYRSVRLVLKDDLIEYLAETANIPRHFGILKKENADEG